MAIAANASNHSAIAAGGLASDWRAIDGSTASPTPTTRKRGVERHQGNGRPDQREFQDSSIPSRHSVQPPKMAGKAANFEIRAACPRSRFQVKTPPRRTRAEVCGSCKHFFHATAGCIQPQTFMRRRGDSFRHEAIIMNVRNLRPQPQHSTRPKEAPARLTGWPMASSR